MYAEVGWVLVSSGTQVQLKIILDPDYLPENPSVSYDYDNIGVSCGIIKQWPYPVFESEA